MKEDGSVKPRSKKAQLDGQAWRILISGGTPFPPTSNVLAQIQGKFECSAEYGGTLELLSAIKADMSKYKQELSFSYGIKLEK